jgi:hypothetical protein
VLKRKLLAKQLKSEFYMMRLKTTANQGKRQRLERLLRKNSKDIIAAASTAQMRAKSPEIARLNQNQLLAEENVSLSEASPKLT